MRNIKKEIIFISNPFGYGPTGKLLSVMYKAINSWDCDFYVIGNDLCTEIIGKSNKFKVIDLDQRNVDELKKCLNKFENPYIISSLNQFALMVSNDLKIPNAFIDGLVWLWDKIPDLEYSLANHYFALKFPGTEKKIIGYNKIDLVSYITPPKEDSKKCKVFEILLHIGGAKNPYTGLQTIYLDFLATIINKINFNKEVLVTGGKDAINYLKLKIKNNNVKLASLIKEEFNYVLQNAKYFITTPGLTACMESFNYKIPTNFLLPWNLSQWKILEVFQNNDIGQLSMTWEKLFDKNFDYITSLDEQKAMPKINKIIELAISDGKILDKIIENFNNMILNIPKADSQNKFIEYTGYNGADEIINKLTEYWEIKEIL